MVAFLLGILKVIGIILLVLLLLVLVIAAIVLFVPIRYQGTGSISEEKKEAHAKVTWLLKAVRVNVDYLYPESPVISVKVLWIDVLEILEKQKEKASGKGKKQEETSVDKPHKPVETTAESLAGLDEENLQQEEQKTQSSTNAVSETEQEVVEEIADTKIQDVLESCAEEEKTTLKEKIENIVFKIKSIYDKISNVIYNIKYYIAIFQEEDTKQLLANAWDAVLKILKSIRPKVFECKGEFGFATPDTTGQAYGIYCAVLPHLGEHVQLVPNFEEQVLRGEVKLKGKITIFVIVLNALRIVFDKRLQPLINKLKNGGVQNGRE